MTATVVAEADAGSGVGGRIERFRITRFAFARDRVIGDSQVRSTAVNLGVLELETDQGLSGTGFFQDLFHPLPGEMELSRTFAETVLPSLKGAYPASLVHRLARPRGGNNRQPPYNFAEAAEQAVWDLYGQALGLPLWQVLGGKEPTVPAYASGLDYHLSDAAFSAFFGQAKALGFKAFKIKVGHPEVARDLRRLALLSDAVGQGALVMVDANEAWTPKETICRLNLFRDAGFAIHWVEDPCLRDDFGGLRQIARALPFTRLNTGEYLDLAGKRRLLEARAVDILNVHGRIGQVMRAAWLAGEHGVEVSLGNTPMELGVHLATALPECRWLEYSFHNYAGLLETPVRISDGVAHAPTAPGHGLRLDARVRERFRAPDIADFHPHGPVGPIDLAGIA